MPEYVVARPLLIFTEELTRVAPRRTLPDWFVGDRRHKEGISDHNIDDTPGWRTEQTDSDSIPEVRGVDLRLPLNAPFTPEQLVQWLIKRARAGKLPWLRYVIFKSRIWTRSGRWVTQVYTGPNKHNEHAHVSSLASKDNDNTSAGLSGLIPVQPISSQGGEDMELNDTVNLITGKDIAYSSPTTTVAGVLASTNYYTLVVRNMAVKLQTTVDGLIGTVQTIAQMMAEADGSPEAAAALQAIREELKALRQQVENDTRDAVADALEGGAPAVRADA